MSSKTDLENLIVLLRIVIPLFEKKCLVTSLTSDAAPSARARAPRLSSDLVQLRFQELSWDSRFLLNGKRRPQHGHSRKNNSSKQTRRVKWRKRGEPLPFGGGGGSSPSRIFSCFSVSTSLRLCVLIFLRSFFVNIMATTGVSFGSATGRKIEVYEQSIESWIHWPSSLIIITLLSSAIPLIPDAMFTHLGDDAVSGVRYMTSTLEDNLACPVRWALDTSSTSCSAWLQRPTTRPREWCPVELPCWVLSTLVSSQRRCQFF